MNQNHEITLYSLTPYDRGGKARWLLAEMGVKHETHWLNGETKEHEGEAYLRINPMGRVPAMKINGRVQIESGAIVAYLADLYLDKGFAPALNAPERLEYLQWLNFASATLDSFQTRIMIIEDIPPGELYQNKFSALISEVKDAFELLNSVLEKNDYLLGKHLSAADISVAYPLYFVQLWPEFEAAFNACPHIKAYLERLQKRPAAIESKLFTYEA